MKGNKTLVAVLAALVVVAVIGVLIYGSVVAPMLSNVPCESIEGGKCISSIEIVYVKPIVEEEGLSIEVKLLSYGTGVIKVQLLSPNGSLIDQKEVIVNGPRVVKLRAPEEPGTFVVRVLHEGKVMAVKRFYAEVPRVSVKAMLCSYDGVRDILELKAIATDGGLLTAVNGAIVVLVDGTALRANLVKVSMLSEGDVYIARLRVKLNPGKHRVSVRIPLWKYSSSFYLLIPEVKVLSAKEASGEVGRYEYVVKLRNLGPGEAIITGAYAYAKIMGAQVILRALYVPRIALKEGEDKELRIVFGGRVEELWLTYEGPNATYVTKPYKLG